jgi:type VI secretion system secreted protein Hcp
MAAQDYFLKLDGIKGESHDAHHKGAIDIYSWSWGGSQQGTMGAGGGGGAGKAVFSDLQLTAKMSKVSPELFLACSTGLHIKKAVLILRKAGGKQVEYYKIILTDVLITSYQTVGNTGDVVPLDAFTLDFAAWEMEYCEQKPDGSLTAPVKVGYDRKTNKKL